MEGFFGMLFGNANNEMVRQVLALETQDDMRDLSEFTGCKADKLPQHWPKSGTFEEILSPRISEQKYEIVDIIVPEDSFLKVQVSMRDPKTQVQVFIIDDADSKEKGKTLASTSAQSQTLSVGLLGRQKAYRMKIVYVFTASDNKCILYDLHVAMKPFADLVSQNLPCEGHKEPPELFEIKGNFYKFDQIYAFSGEYIMK